MAHLTRESVTKRYLDNAHIDSRIIELHNTRGAVALRNPDGRLTHHQCHFRVDGTDLYATYSNGDEQLLISDTYNNFTAHDLHAITLPIEVANRQ